ncbi:MAG: hypothetical protein KGH52_00225 [Candidatus Micrarchaeota archaeon]|nr:hypothetical protein [Candidatus Micrarchaeota archaeon]
MKKGLLVIGVIVLIVGIVIFAMSYGTVAKCNTFFGGLFATISTLFGGNGAQTCSNARAYEVIGPAIAIIGLAGIIIAFRHK